MFSGNRGAFDFCNLGRSEFVFAGAHDALDLPGVARSNQFAETAASRETVSPSGLMSVTR